MPTYVLRDGELVEKHLASPHPLNAAPYVISDCMDATLNHADGKRYDSKRAFERAVRAHGCEIVGNDPAGRSERRHEAAPSITAADIKQTLDQMRSR